MSEYLCKPLLINGYKSDLRLYVLVTSVKPLTIYLYEEGLVRFATEPYSLVDQDLLGHLTNYSLNKDSHLFQDTPEHHTGSK